MPASVKVTVDVMRLEHFRLFVWEVMEVQTRLRVLGLTEEAERLADAVRRLVKGHDGE